MIDPVHGGMRGAPKFPQPMMLEFLWRAGQRMNDKRYFGAVELSLARMCEGGIYDHLGGGFSRYSVDERWLTPHFEKMLYDNALLLELLALAHQRSANDLFRTRARETVGLARARDDDRGGRLLRLARCRLRRRGGQVLRLVARRDRGRARQGRRGVLCRALRRDRAKAISKGTTFSIASSTYRAAWRTRAGSRRLRAKLLAVRAERVRPGLDDKVLADWNGLMIAGLVNAGVAFDEPTWIEMAARAFLFIAAKMAHGDRLGHSWREGRLLVPGLASDHAAMIRAALDAARGDRRARLSRARARLAGDTRPPLRQSRQRRLFPHRRRRRGPGGAAERHHRRCHAEPECGGGTEPDPARGLHRPACAGASRPTGCSTGSSSSAGENLFAHLALLNALDLRLRAAEIVVAGQGARADELLIAARKLPFLDRIVLRASSAAALPATHPALAKIRPSQTRQPSSASARPARCR